MSIFYLLLFSVFILQTCNFCIINLSFLQVVYLMIAMIIIFLEVVMLLVSICILKVELHICPTYGSNQQLWSFSAGSPDASTNFS